MKKEMNIASITPEITSSYLIDLITVTRGEVGVGEKKMCEKEMSPGFLN